MEGVLGLNEIQWGWRVEGMLSAAEAVRLALKLIELVDMTPDGPPDLRIYPNENDKGGNGLQLYQPLVESWLIISTWPQHGFLRITLSSCLPYDPQKVSQWLLDHVGMVQAQGGYDL